MSSKAAAPRVYHQVVRRSGTHFREEEPSRAGVYIPHGGGIKTPKLVWLNSGDTTTRFLIHREE